ncbi:methionine--tRNA ligase [Nocardiopsis ganjiahuensis]|uniref:methionine--tRNA ligase n=1 Tax=Nocardiopsis ganjiahuensis TaxID=239984 RepID=UPI000344DCD6|nr:methionine--tRNA ligase [Nocardiopsis ganjiahuensis]
MGRYYLTTAIPYVNGAPHVGHALELVQADTLARYHRGIGDEVRAQTGTDDNALKNVLSARAAGLDTAEYVDLVSRRFLDLAGPLSLSFDDSVRTAFDPRHRPGVEKLWNACLERGDLYRRSYTGLYCTGCEQFHSPEELPDGLCPEHRSAPEEVAEENWFFRLSRYQDRLYDLVSSGELRVEPGFRRREVLSFIRSGLEDFSVSRSVERAPGWGIPVPGDPGQVVYVWYDALANYVTGPGYGTDPEGYDHWWTRADQRVHVIGKGILRFHAVYWPALLLSAGLPLPTTVLVHEYLTADGEKISKSAGASVDPVAVTEAFGTDALRWWLLRDVGRSGDTDYTEARLVVRHDEDLANTIGNLVNRTVSMVARYRSGVVPRVADESGEPSLARARVRAAEQVDAAVRAFDLRAATGAVVALADEGNRYVADHEPWALARAERAGEPGKRGRTGPEALDTVLGELVATGRELARLLRPFLPDASARLTEQLGGDGGQLPPAAPVFRRLG